MTIDIRQPMQPLILDDVGIICFKPNLVVRYLLDAGGVDLNTLAAIRYLYPQADWEQFYQLIGYSVSGYGDLSSISQKSKDAADEAAEMLRTGDD
jgi:hypothetical protein